MFPLIRREEIAEQLAERIDKPGKIRQHMYSLCSQTALLNNMAYSDPVTYVRLAIDLYERGRARLGGCPPAPCDSAGGRRVTPSNTVSPTGSSRRAEPREPDRVGASHQLNPRTQRSPMLHLLRATLALPLLAALSSAQLTPSGAQKIDSDEGGFGGLLENADRFGRSVAGIGDLDLDGVPDCIVGARSDDDGGIDAGAIYVLFLNSDATVRAEQKISALEGGLPAGLLDAGDFFGYSVVPVGDLDSDGVVDIAVGAPNDDDSGNNAGAVYLINLTRTGTVKAISKITNGTPGFGAPLALGDAFGMGCGELGDFNGDGWHDLAVPAPNDDDGGNQRGAVYVLFLGPGGAIQSTVKYSATSGGFAGALSDGDSFGGRQVARIGDLDGDGRDELAVGTFRDDDGGADRGAFWVLFLDATFQVTSQQKVSQTQGGFTPALADGDLFGMTLAPIGDADLDGVPDLVVSSNRDDDGGPDRGALYLLHMNSDGTVKGSSKISSATGLAGEPGFYLLDGERFGRALGVLGDLRGDGSFSIGVGAGAGVDGGAIWILTFDRSQGSRYCASTANSTGAAAQTTASGSLSLGHDHLTLFAQPVPNTAHVFFFGPNQTQVPFGNGFLCANGGLSRIGTPSLSSGNVAQESLGLSALGLTPGSYNFQCWFRDPAAGGAAFNTSGGLELTFAP